MGCAGIGGIWKSRKEVGGASYYASLAQSPHNVAIKVQVTGQQVVELLNVTICPLDNPLCSIDGHLVKWSEVEEMITRSQVNEPLPP